MARATREVIVSGGTINSPQILLLSGIGPKEHLQSVNVPVVKDLPGKLAFILTVQNQRNVSKQSSLFDIHRCRGKLT